MLDSYKCVSLSDRSIYKQNLKRLVESPLENFFGQFFSLKVPEFLHVGFNLFKEHCPDFFLVVYT